VRLRPIALGGMLVMGPVLAFGTGCKGTTAEAAQEEKPKKTPGVDVELGAEALKAARVAVAPARKAKRGATLSAVGTLELSPKRVAKIGSLVEGRITKINVEVGDKVQAGGVLATIESASIGRARADHLSAMARLRAADKNVETVEQLVKRGIDPERSLVIARTERDVANFEVAAAAQKLKAVGIDGASGASGIALVTPLAGTVLDTKARLGEAVASSDTLFTVGDLSEVWLVVDVYERDLAKVKIGDEATVTLLALPGKTFSGKVGHVSETLDPVRRAAFVRVVLPNADGALRPGTSASARILTGAGGSVEVVVVPKSAIQLIDGLAHVFVEKEAGKYQLRAVELGLANDPDVEVARGLDAGERVVVDGAFILKSEVLREQMGKND